MRVLFSGLSSVKTAILMSVIKETFQSSSNLEWCFTNKKRSYLWGHFTNSLMISIFIYLFFLLFNHSPIAPFSSPFRRPYVKYWKSKSDNVVSHFIINIMQHILLIIGCFFHFILKSLFYQNISEFLFHIRISHQKWETK